MDIHISDRTIYEGDKPIGEVLADGTVKMARGHHTKRAAAEELLSRGGQPAGTEQPPTAPYGAQGDPATGFVDSPLETKGSLGKPPAGDPTMGDKDPAVIVWWFKHRPKEARERYKDRNFAGKEQYFPTKP